MRIVSAHEAISAIASGQRIYVHEAAMAPQGLLTALAERAPELRDVEVMHLHIEGAAPHVAPELRGHLRHNALFVGGNTRHAVEEGRADFTPALLSDLPALIVDGTLGVDVALVTVSPPDSHGFCRLGMSAALARTAVEHARLVIAEINPNVPRTFGDTAVHESRIHFGMLSDRAMPATETAPFGPLEGAIGEHAARLVDNGATIQVGIGAVPNAVLAALRSHTDLGVHTEMFSDGLVDLVQRGVITNRRKTRFAGRIITSFALGTQRLHAFVDSNPSVEFHSTAIVNDALEIRSQFQMTAVNSCIEIDLTGQVCADSIGERIYSGVGGQLDFVEGALRSPGGKAIMVLPSTACSGQRSRIVPHLSPGAGVVTTRAHVQWVVTEHGAVNLRGKSLRERALALTSIAHPDFRAELRAAATARHLVAC